MKIYNVMKVPQGLGYDDVDYDAIYQSGYTAGYDDGYNNYECEEIVVPSTLQFELFNSYTLPLDIQYSGEWSITYTSVSHPDNMVTLSQTEGRGNTEVLVTFVGDLPCTGFPTIFGQLIVSDTFGRSKGVALSYVTCHSSQTPYVEKITITSISGAKIPPQTPVEWARYEGTPSTYPNPITLNWPSTGGSFTYNIQMHMQDAEWWDSYGNEGSGNTSGLTVTVPAWAQGDTELRSYSIGFYNNCCRTHSGSPVFVSGSIDEPEDAILSITHNFPAQEGQSREIPEGGGIYTMTISGNTNWTANTVNFGSGVLCTLSQNSGAAYESTNVTVTFLGILEGTKQGLIEVGTNPMPETGYTQDVNYFTFQFHQEGGSTPKHLSFYPDDITDYDGTGGTFNLQVRADEPYMWWNAYLEGGSSWCQISPSSGSGLTTNMTVTLQPYYESGMHRTDTIIFTDNYGQEWHIEVEQVGTEPPAA